VPPERQKNTAQKKKQFLCHENKKPLVKKYIFLKILILVTHEIEKKIITYNYNKRSGPQTRSG
jgi:hypothetical protein